MKQSVIAIVVLCMQCIATVHAQRLQDWILLGDRAMEDADPVGALRYYSQAMRIDSAKGELNYKYADALRANQDYRAAAYYYYKVYRRERGKLFPESGAWLATMQKQSGDYGESKETWRRVRDQYANDKSSYWYRKAVQEMRSCDLAAEWSASSSSLELKALPKEVNSDASEFAGSFRNNADLVFTSLRGEFDIQGHLKSEEPYVSRLYVSDSTFTEDRLFPVPVGLEGSYFFSENDASSMQAFVETDAKGAPYISIFEKDGSKPIVTLPQLPDSSWYSHPAFGKMNGREVLFFSSDRPGGQGREDIWLLYLDDPDQDLINAGKNVNSPGSEITPFFRSDLEMLYFASDWHHGFGGYDLFSIAVLKNDFGYPKNLLQPFNTPSNDLYYSFNQILSKGIITSNRKGSEGTSENGCCNDLWSFAERQDAIDSLPVIANLAQLNDYLPVKLYFHNDEPEPRTTKDKTDLDYLETYWAYTALLPTYEEAYSAGLNAGADVDAENEMDRFFIDDVDRGAENLEFFTDLLLRELEKGSQVEITVKGFASPLARTDYNVKLTSRRISSLENYFKGYKKGVLMAYLNHTAQNGGSLSLNKIPFGEYVASQVISDNPNEANAIYGIAAAKERKIEIVSVQRAASDSSVAEIHFDQEIMDLGSLRASSTTKFVFPFYTLGQLLLDSLAFDDRYLDVEILDFGGPSAIGGVLKPLGLRGKQNQIITVYGSFVEGSKELNVAFEIEQ